MQKIKNTRIISLIIWLIIAIVSVVSMPNYILSGKGEKANYIPPECPKLRGTAALKRNE